MTLYQRIYEAFLAKILEDEWTAWDEDSMEQDLRQILESAIPWFKFPRFSLERDENGFVEDLNSEEIQILSSYMKCEWLNRTILTWENIKPLYEERDFSQANLLDKFNKSLQNELTKARRLESIYYRAINGRPRKYTKMAGDQ